MDVARTAALFAALSALSVLPARVPAQRAKAELAWTGRSVVLDHGVPPFGKHSIEEMVPGEPWRLGSNEASTLLVETPLLAGSSMVAPGHYRVRLLRGKSDGQRFHLQVDGGGWALGAETEPEYLAGTLRDAEPQKKLQVRWVTADADAGQQAPNEPANRDATLEIRFGPHQVDVPVTVLGARPAIKVGSFTLTPFAVPADALEERLQAGQPTVIASLEPRARPSRKEPPFFNVVLLESRALLVPALRAPVDSFGFAHLQPYDAALTRRADVEWAERERGVALLEITEASATKRELVLTCAFGKKLGAVKLELPRRAGG